MADNDSKPNGQNRERLGNVPTAPVTFVRKPKPFDREAAMRAYEREHPEAVETRMRALRERHAGTSLRIFPSDPKKFFEAVLKEFDLKAGNVTLEEGGEVFKLNLTQIVKISQAIDFE